ncbi:MAG: DUF559 domain-containing protein [Flavobacteriales bacterium]|nr:DUF559 domain-containing protein [Flavobacteriales bacterium]MCB9190500.1 DUF559 domain-containing protein [Flavobacteriales bacterium]
MVPGRIIPYNPKLKEFARQLRNNSTRSEIWLWKRLKGKQRLGYDFHRQKPIDNYILDFFCHELMLGIELDGISHMFDEIQERDHEKTQRMNQLGITILRFHDDEVFQDIDEVVRAIDTWIENHVNSTD